MTIRDTGLWPVPKTPQARHCGFLKTATTSARARGPCHGDFHSFRGGTLVIAPTLSLPTSTTIILVLVTFSDSTTTRLLTPLFAFCGRPGSQLSAPNVA